MNFVDNRIRTNKTLFLLNQLLSDNSRQSHSHTQPTPISLITVKCSNAQFK